MDKNKPQQSNQKSGSDKSRQKYRIIIVSL